MAHINEPVAIRRYANRRFYQTGTGSDVTLESLADLVEDDDGFVAYDAESGPITRWVLHANIIEPTCHG
jgi:polyhydroxyalkanoate synthesis regulator protein